MRNFRNVQPSQQRELEVQFSWLSKVHEMAPVAGVEKISISVFDHWLSRDEAEMVFTEVPKELQARRDAMLHGLALRLREEFGAVEFVLRGRQKDRPRFRKRVAPGDESRQFKRRNQLAISQLGAIYYEGYDDTWHLYFTSRQSIEPVIQAARAAGLHLLEDGQPIIPANVPLTRR